MCHMQKSHIILEGWMSAPACCQSTCMFGSICDTRRDKQRFASIDVIAGTLPPRPTPSGSVTHTSNTKQQATCHGCKLPVQLQVPQKGKPGEAPPVALTEGRRSKPSETFQVRGCRMRCQATQSHHLAQAELKVMQDVDDEESPSHEVEAQDALQATCR